ncbi:hypothetical protein AYX15_02804 [Cryptococcus neoformans]|nr:hypothetical protein AYX15_02804 [Cryptococcus neoformans var. grubii]
MRPALTLLTLVPYLGGTFANTCRAADAGTSATTAAAAASSSDASGTSVIGNNLLASSNTAAGGAGTTAKAASVSNGGGSAVSATDSSAASAATSAAESVFSGDHSSASTSVSARSSSAQSAAYPQGSQMGTDLVLSNPSDDCKCGYSISSLNDEYFPYKFAYTFSALSDGNARDGLAAAGWVVNDGKYVGGAANGNRCWGNKDNVNIDSGDLVLTVPKDQTASPNMECAEIAFNETNLFEGVFQTEALLSGVDGTCQAFWLNHSIATQYADELDIEVISSTIDSDGVWYSNWPPNGDPNNPDSLTSAHTNVPFPGININDPRKTYNNYTIAWLSSSTTRYYNGAKQDSPIDNQPEHNMIFTINNWSNGGTGWTHGPPTGEDSNLRVKSVLLYYRTQDVQDMATLDSSCTDSDVCKV